MHDMQGGRSHSHRNSHMSRYSNLARPFGVSSLREIKRCLPKDSRRPRTSVICYNTRDLWIGSHESYIHGGGVRSPESRC